VPPTAVTMLKRIATRTANDDALHLIDPTDTEWSVADDAMQQVTAHAELLCVVRQSVLEVLCSHHVVLRVLNKRT
jgi:hypothetical protein